MNTTLSGWATLVALVIVLGIACLLWWFTWKARDTSRDARSLVQRFPFRRIRAFEALSKLLDVSIERGKIAHVSLGDTGIGGSRTATILSGLTPERYGESGLSPKFPRLGRR